MPRGDATTGPLLEPGVTCARTATADALAFLVDGASYYPALAHALVGARHCIAVLGWDAHSKTRLDRDGWPWGELPPAFGPLLDTLCEREPELGAWVLSWDPSPIYALEREALLRLRLGVGTHERLRFALDDRHPTGGSQHQKVVVVDDAVAFCGGIDITVNRWDRSAHAPDDEDRVRENDDEPYAPFHDVQVAVTGEAARALGELFRERWHASGASTPPPDPESRTDEPVPLPGHAPEDARDVEVGIVRTLPRYRGRDAVQETEHLFLRLIERAQRELFIENQYLTSDRIGAALAERLAEPDGPDVCLVLPRTCSGWLEEATMGEKRAAVLEQLRAADEHGRLRAVFPSNQDTDVFIHSKVLLIDGASGYVGSANCSARSLGLDSECGLALDGSSSAAARRACATLRARLLAEHTGRDPADIPDVDDATAVAIVDAQPEDRARGLFPVSEVDVDADPPAALRGTLHEFADPSEPLEPALDDDGRRSLKLRVGALALLVIAALAAWLFTPLAELSVDDVVSWLQKMSDVPAAPALALGLLTLTVSAGLPLNLALLAAVLVLGPVTGFFVGLGGALLSALIGFAGGRLVGVDTLLDKGPERLRRVLRAVRGRSLLAVGATRLVPLAPYAVVNLALGAIGVRLRDVVLGTLIGLLPGVLAVSVFGDRVKAALENPDLETVAIAGGALLAAALALWAVQSLVARRMDEVDGEEGAS